MTDRDSGQGSGSGNDATPFDERFVAGARFHEPSARARARQARAFRRRGKTAARRNRRNRRRGRLRKLTPWLVLVVVITAYWQFGNGGTATGERVAFDKINADRVRVVYILPVDALVNPKADDAIRHYIDIANTWLTTQTGGKILRIEATAGQINVERIFVSKTRDDIAHHDSFMYVRNQVFAKLHVKTNELPLVFVAAATRNTDICGETIDVAIVWLGNDQCYFGDGFTLEQPAFPPVVAAHEIMHALGAAPDCAPHKHGRHHHVNDSNHDLMYDGPTFAPIVLDVNHDDYFDHEKNGCRDVADAHIWTAVAS